MLLPGGITVRSGPWRPEDESSGTSAAAAAAVASSAGTSGAASIGKAGWAVEVGWFLGGEKGGAGERSKNERVVLTTVLDAKSMTPLAVWRGVVEKRK